MKLLFHQTHPSSPSLVSLMRASLTLDSVVLDAVELLTLLASVFPMLGLQVCATTQVYANTQACATSASLASLHCSLHHQ